MRRRIPPVKHFPVTVLITLMFGAMLLFPKAVFNGASEGLLLWFQVVFPTLFPFMLITNLLMDSGGLAFISGIFRRPFRRIFGVSGNGSFAVLAGFLCGYPMGAKVTADLLRTGRITRAEGQYLLSFCNNTSPVFIINFIVWKTLGEDQLLLPSLAVLMGGPVLLSFLFRRVYLEKGKHFFPDFSAPGNRSGRETDFSLLDLCMMNSFESIVKVGGYIILFSVVLSLLSESGQHSPVFTALTAVLEVTNGILIIDGLNLRLTLSWPLIMALTSFGGLCSVAQTQCMIQDTGLKISHYIIQKLAAAGAASLLAVFYVNFLQAAF